MSFLTNLKTTPPNAPPPPPPSAARPALAANDPFAGMSEVKMKREYLPLGQHALKVLQCNTGFLPEAIGGRFFFGVDFEVLESSDPNVRPGSTRSWMTQLYPNGKGPFQRDVKGFLAAVSGIGASQISDNDPNIAASEANPLASQTVIADIHPGVSINPKTGTPYNETRFVSTK